MGLLTEDRDDNRNGFIKMAVLIALMVQNASHALLTRYSQGILKEKYSSTEVVLVGEFLKMCVSGYLSVVDRSETDAQGQGTAKLLWLMVHGKKVIVLVVLYSIANIMSYYALARVDASVYSVLLQLKIVTTASFAVLILGRNITLTKWRALFLLVMGCVLVASPAFNRPPTCDAEETGGEEDEHVSGFESLLGVGAVLAMVIISGYSAIYFEQMLKKTTEKITIWERNFQLALYSLVLLVIVWMYETNTRYNYDEMHEAMFAGWTVNTCLIAVVQASGGLLVAATLKYADAILKTLATCGSIVLSAVIGWMLLGGTLDIFVSIGCLSTILAIFNYVLAPNVE
jgi:solute carrier family 35 (UDP-sugar transporter), member A1/2/3